MFFGDDVAFVHEHVLGLKRPTVDRQIANRERARSVGFFRRGNEPHITRAGKMRNDEQPSRVSTVQHERAACFDGNALAAARRCFFYFRKFVFHERRPHGGACLARIVNFVVFEPSCKIFEKRRQAIRRPRGSAPELVRRLRSRGGNAGISTRFLIARVCLRRKLRRFFHFFPHERLNLRGNARIAREVAGAPRKAIELRFRIFETERTQIFYEFRALGNGGIGGIFRREFAGDGGA